MPDPAPGAPFGRQPKEKTITGPEQMFLTMTLAAFGCFAVVLACVDFSTTNVRDQAGPSARSRRDPRH